MRRRIMHVDMDAFYASVEVLDNPALRGRPVIVGGGVRGVVAAASYEARRFGVHSAMPMFQTRRLCPEGVVVPPRMGRYKEVSRRVMAVLAGVSPLLEQVSIDEAYVDITGTEGLHGPPEALGRRVKEEILGETGCTCSVGVAPNRFLAKLASEMRKPDGLVVIGEGEVAEILRDLPVAKMHGVGGKTADGLHALGVRTAGDILRFSPEFWVKRLGKWGARLHELARGIDETPVTPESEAKSSGAETTFDHDIGDREELTRWVLRQAERVGRDLRREGLRGRTVTLKVKYASFRAITRSRTLPEATSVTRVIFETAARLLAGVSLAEKVRLTGVTVSGLERGPRQRALFGVGEVPREERLDCALDRIHEKFGKKAIERGEGPKTGDSPGSPAGKDRPGPGKNG